MRVVCVVNRAFNTQSPHMPALPQSNPHLDILMGRDETLDCADFMMPGSQRLSRSMDYADVCTASQLAQPLDIHTEMEKKLRM